MEAKFVYESLNEPLNELLLEGFIDKFPGMSRAKKLSALASMVLLGSGLSLSSSNKEIASSIPKIIELSQHNKIDYDDVKNVLMNLDLDVFKYNYDILSDANSFVASDSIKNFIKEHETLQLTAYKLNDGRITIGYGHAEPEETSKFKEGQKISIHKANHIFEHDIKICENGIKRLFNMWKNQGIDIKISQNMFDAMVSIAYNMGVGGLRSSDFVLLLKKGDYEEAADLILDTGVKNAKSFPGLADRREKEREIFLQDLL